MLDAWTDILQGVPDSRLLLKYQGLDDLGIGQRLRSRFADRGVVTEAPVCSKESRHQMNCSLVTTASIWRPILSRTRAASLPAQTR